MQTLKKETTILSQINFPKDLKTLSIKDLKTLCTDVRAKIIKQLSVTPGHFGASLGVVELSVAIHSIFNTPDDLLIWDVGHQAYAHKILTGRKNSFHTLRILNGISGFPRISESQYDNFGTGHSSTSTSAIMGMAVASKLNKNEDRQHIAIIGDGALTAGMAFEALNNLSDLNANILVIINDNQQSIDDSVGALDKHLNGLRNQKSNNIFKDLDLNYYGIVNGNDFEAIYKELLLQKEKKGVRILHCKTIKGFGYKYAEKGNPTIWHAPGKFDVKSGERLSLGTDFPKKYQDVFGYTLVDLAIHNKNIVAITPAMTSGSSLHWFKEKFPNRFFDVGIAEQHAVTFAAGLATQGKIPFCVIYSTFLQRAYDQIVHDVALQNLPVVFCIDRAGVVGEDGATHHGIFDISFLRALPNLIVISPRDEQELINAMHWVNANAKQPIAIRYPRGRGTLKKLIPAQPIRLGKGSLLKKGKKIAIISIGKTAIEVSKAIEKLNEKNIFPAHYDIRFIKPLDKTLLLEIFKKYNYLVVVEDGIKAGGTGSAILEFLATTDFKIKMTLMGIDDAFIEHGTNEELYKVIGIDANSICKLILKFSEPTENNL